MFILQAFNGCYRKKKKNEAEIRSYVTALGEWNKVFFFCKESTDLNSKK